MQVFDDYYVLQSYTLYKVIFRISNVAIVIVDKEFYRITLGTNI